MKLSRIIWPKTVPGRIVARPALLVVGYFASALFVLDFRDVAYPDDEEYFQGQMVAFGPRPRWFLCLAAYRDIPAGWSYSGNEWALVLYRPICERWAAYKGFALPSKWRQ